MIKRYPIFLKLTDVPCLVVGGGSVATRKAKDLLACGARVRVVSPRAGAGLKRMAAARRVRWVRRRFRSSDLSGVRLIVAATGDSQVNTDAARQARRRGRWINVVDRPELCDFIVPAVVRRGSLTLAVSTAGASPALARWVRQDLQRRYGPEYRRLLTVMRCARGKIQRDVRSPARRRRRFEQALQAYRQALQKSGG